MSAETADLSKRAIDWGGAEFFVAASAVDLSGRRGRVWGLGPALLTASPALITGAAIGAGGAGQPRSELPVAAAAFCLVLYRKAISADRLPHERARALERDLREAGSREGAASRALREKIKAFRRRAWTTSSARRADLQPLSRDRQQVYLSGWTTCARSRSR